VDEFGARPRLKDLSIPLDFVGDLGGCVRHAVSVGMKLDAYLTFLERPDLLTSN
jgi:hypothetical protein